MKKYKVNDFFCGCGGISVAFQQAGFDVSWACDFDKYAVQSYKKNVGDYVIQADIKKLTYQDIPYADVWTFGFACQDLSGAGLKKGFVLKCQDCGTEWKIETENDVKCPNCGSTKFKSQSRSGTFFEIMRLLDETQENNPKNIPQVLMAENVKGLKRYIPVLKAEYAKRGYKAYVQLYNSKYWGVPQSRERYFIVGVRADTPFEFPIEQHERVPKLQDILDKEVDEKYYIDDSKCQTIINNALKQYDCVDDINDNIYIYIYICKQSGMMNIDGVNRTLRVKWDCATDKAHNYQHMLLPEEWFDK